MVRHYPWFLATYDALPHPVMRADTVGRGSAWGFCMADPFVCMHAAAMARARSLVQTPTLAYHRYSNPQARYMYMHLIGGVYVDLGEKQFTGGLV